MKIQGKKPRENMSALRFMMSIFGCQHKYPVQFNVERSFLSAILVKGSVVIMLVVVFFRISTRWLYGSIPMELRRAVQRQIVGTRLISRFAGL